jgi:hypothetical protein
MVSGAIAESQKPTLKTQTGQNADFDGAPGTRNSLLALSTAQRRKLSITDASRDRGFRNGHGLATLGHDKPFVDNEGSPSRVLETFRPVANAFVP